MNGLTQEARAQSSDWGVAARDPRGAMGGAALHDELPHAHVALHSGPIPDLLGRTIEREVIPRLVDAHRGQRPSTHDIDHAALPDGADVAEFTALLASRDVAAAMARIDAARARGVALELVYLHLLVPAARRLSELWQADLCHYEEIAVGMLHLQQVLQALSPDFSGDGQCRSGGRRVLLLSAPGEQNMLGLFMVTEFYRCVSSEFFQHAGWEVWRAPPTSRAQLLGILGSQWFDVIDVSATCEARLPLLAGDLDDMRRASRNPQVRVVVGGPVFSEHLELLDRVGADALAVDPRDAVVQAELLVAPRRR